MFDEKAARRAAFFWLLAAIAALVAAVVWNDPLRWAATRMQPLLVAAAFLAVCTGFGWAARAPDVLSAAALGCGITGALVFVAGLLHAFVPATFVTLYVIGFGLFGLAVSRSRSLAVRNAGSTPKPAIATALILATLVLIVPFVVAPDVSTDSLEYHLLIPKLYLQQNGIPYLPLFVESNYPSLAEYDFVALLATGNDVAAKCFHFLCAILVLFAIARLARQIAPQSDRALAAALFITMPVAALTSGWSWNDMLFTLFVLLAISHLIDGRYVLAGVLFGFASWTKYTFVFVGVALAVVMVRGLVQRWWRLRDAIAFAVPVVAIAAIWMTRNAVYTGNPVYPFLNSVFHSPFWSEVSDRYFRTTLTRYEFPQWHWWTWFAFPVLLTLKPRIIDVATGALPLVLLPLAFLELGGHAAAVDDEERRHGRRTPQVLRTYALALAIAWPFFRTETRSLLTLFAVLAALYAANITRLPAWRAVVLAGFAMNAVILLVATRVIADPTLYFLGRESRVAYIERMDPKQRVYDWLNAQPGGGVLLIGLHDPYYLNRAALFSSCCDKPVAQDLVEKHGTAEAVAAALRSEGVTHVVVRTPIYSRENAEHLYWWTDAQREVFRSFLATSCVPVAKFGDVVVFALR